MPTHIACCAFVDVAVATDGFALLWIGCARAGNQDIIILHGTTRCAMHRRRGAALTHAVCMYTRISMYICAKVWPLGRAFIYIVYERPRPHMQGEAGPPARSIYHVFSPRRDRRRTRETQPAP